MQTKQDHTEKRVSKLDVYRAELIALREERRAKQELERLGPKTRSYRCRACSACDDHWAQRCPACGARLGMVPADFESVPREPLIKQEVKLGLGSYNAPEIHRMSTGIKCIDKVFGESPSYKEFGIARQSLVLMAGDSGIGKSTLLIQIANNLHDDCEYITSEEDVDPLARRARRLHLNNIDSIIVRSTTSLGEIIGRIRETRAHLIIIDSLQNVRWDIPIPGRGGKPVLPKHSQHVERDIATELAKEARANKRTMILVSHITKEGDLAGLKTIEHLVDTVVWFKGDKTQKRRAFLSEKNRNGEGGLRARLVMRADGLHQDLSDEHDPETNDPEAVEVTARDRLPG